MKIVIASDLDDTLLNNDGEISSYTKEILFKAYENDILIVPCTSRAYTGLPTSLLETPIRYFVCSNGALVWDKLENKVVLNKSLSKEIIAEILFKIKDSEIAKTITVNGEVYSEKILKEIFKATGDSDSKIKKILDQRILVDNVDSIIDKYERFNKLHLNFLNPQVRLKYLKLLKSSHYHMTSSSNRNIEITHNDAQKGKTLLDLCNYLGIKNKQLFTFGDNLNDIALFEVADIKIAVNNAKDELKDLADIILEATNEENGVAKYINERIFMCK